MTKQCRNPFSLFFTSVLVFLLAGLIGCAGIRGSSPSTGGSGNGSGSSAPPPPKPTGSLKTSVNHIVLLMQENRSFDHYFGKLNDYRVSKGLSADADDLSKAGNVSLKSFNGSGNIAPYKMNSACVGDLSSSWLEAHYDIDLNNVNHPADPAPMNGFPYMAGGFAHNDPTHGGFDVAGKRAMGHYDASQLTFYYWAATQFATSDRWFSAAPARTQINRMYFLAATSNGYAFPGDDDFGHPPLNMGGIKNIFQLLEDAKVTWKVYVTDGWRAGKTGSTYMNYFSGFTSQHIDNFADATQFAIDAQNGTLPQVALIESGYIESGSDEHPQNPIDKGAKYARSLVTALMNSPSWKESVMFITYDEGGGFYDHVPPMKTVNPDGIKPRGLVAGYDPQGDFDITGHRVPLLVISPFAKQGFISHTPADFTALLKFIEKRFDLPNLNKRDAFQPDMDEYFDWSGPNLGSITAPEQVSLPCYFDHLP
jgi:phospholipase C